VTAPPYRGRFAPSPTGPLHFGSLVAALASWLDARSHGGAWLVRIEDVDAPRTVPGAADAILRVLDAFGLHWDEDVAWQSRRTALYDEALERLVALGLAYPCGCSRREIADSGLRGIEGALYPGTCRPQTGDRPGFGPGLPKAGSVPGFRVRVPAGWVAFEDRVQGPVAQDLAGEIGDFVLRRRDGLHAYQLAVVVDDAQQRITDVVRGADLLASTPRQVYLQRELGLPTPRYLHVPVAVNAAGEKLSKQTLARAVEPDRAATLLHAALAFLGQPRPAGAEPREMLAEAVARWDPARIPRQRTAPVTRGDRDVTGAGI
jgi:glutamyl-Q tRNA(Asp) synthetase